MSKYQGCENCKHTNVDKEKYPCSTCTHNMPTYIDNFKPMTNADQIRNMTNEELAEFLSDLIKAAEKHEYCTGVGDWLQWLQAEVKEGENIVDS